MDKYQVCRQLENVKYDGTFTSVKKTFMMTAQTQDKVLKDIPLKKVTHNIKTNQDLAQIEIQLSYSNLNTQLLESSFYFAISADACFDDFSAKIGEKIVKGVIKEKEEAKKEYDEGIKQGKTMAMSEIDPDLKDVIKVKLGNLEPNETIVINLRYLESIQNYQGVNEIRIPFQLRPRYTSSRQYHQQTFLDKNTYTDKAVYDWDINLDLNFKNNKISNIQCINPKVTNVNEAIVDDQQLQNQKIKNLQGERVQFSLKFDKPDTDFILRFNSKEQIMCTLQKIDRDDEPNKYCSMISIKNTYQSVKSFKNDQIPQEFIFILDRSGSMSGQRMKLATSALSKLLKCLPQGSYFNIISFGSDYECLYQTCKKATPQMIEKICKSVKKMDADLGCTEMFLPLQHVYEKICTCTGYSRNIFLITDGGVSNQKEIVNLVKEYQNQAQLYSLGIGSGVSTNLVKEVANSGNGKFEFVIENEDIDKKMQELLQHSLYKKFTDFKLEFDKDKVEAVVPDINCMNFIRENENIQCFILLKEGFQETDVKLTINGQQVFQKKIEEQNYQKSDFLHKMANFKILKKYLQNTLSEGDIYDDIYIQKEMQIERLKEEALHLSVKYQILCELTAFICEVKNLKDEVVQQNLQSQTVNVPNIQEQLNKFNLQAYDSLQACSSNINLGQQCVKNSKRSYQPKHKSSCCDVAGGPIILPEISRQQKGVSQQDNNDSIVLNVLETINKSSQPQQNIYKYFLVTQNSDGSWNTNEANLIALKISKQNILDTLLIVQNQFQDMLITPNLLLTILIIQYLENNCQQSRDIWQLAFKKAKRFLESKNIEYEEFLEYVN